MLIVAIAGESYMPIGKISNSTKIGVESGALSNRRRDTYDNINNTDIDKVAIAGSPKRGIILWPVLIVVIACEKSTKVIAFIIVPTIGIGPFFIGVINMA